MNYHNYVNISTQAISTNSGIINKARRLLRNSALDILSEINKSVEKRFLRSLLLHNVFDDQNTKFEHLILNLKKIGEFINTATCISMLKGKKEIDGRYFHLSFDDGFKNNYTNVIPILNKYNVPCLFFIPSRVIGANWELTKNYCLKTAGYNGVIEMLKWEDLREMVSLGFKVGSHTKTHNRLSSISHDIALLEDEIQGSKNEIETNLGIECKYIAWPFGRHGDIDERSLRMIESTGYHACFGGFRGTIFPNKTNIFNIPRHDIDLQSPISHNEYFARGNMEISL